MIYHLVRRCCRSVLGVAVLGLALAGCGSEPSRPRPSLPAFPPLATLYSAEVLPSVKKRIDAGYGRASEHPEDPAANGELGMLLHAHQLLEPARTFYLRACALEADSFRWAYYLGVVESASGRTGEAAASFSAALALDPSYIPARLAAADGSLKSGELENSERVYRETLELSPTLASAHLGLGRVHAARGNSDAAVEEYEKACELHPGFSAAHYALAMAYRDLGEQQKANYHLSLYEPNEGSRPIVEDPLLEEVRRKEAGADAYTRAGVEQVNAGKFRQGAKLLERAIAMNPRDEGASLSLLIAYGHLGDHLRVEEHYRRSIKVFPDSEEIHFNYGTILAQQGKVPEASKLFARVIEINPANANAHANLGYLLEERGEFGSAVRHYRKSIENDPDNPTAHFRLGRLTLQQGHASQAAEHFRAALRKEQDQRDQVLYGLATATAMMGDFAEAVRFAKQARESALTLGHAALARSIEADLKSFEKKAAGQ